MFLSQWKSLEKDGSGVKNPFDEENPYIKPKLLKEEAPEIPLDYNSLPGIQRTKERDYMVESLVIPNPSKTEETQTKSTQKKGKKLDSSRSLNTQDSQQIMLKEKEKEMSVDSQSKYKLAGKSGVNQPRLNKISYFALILSFIFKIKKANSLEPIIDLLVTTLSVFGHGRGDN